MLAILKAKSMHVASSQFADNVAMLQIPNKLKKQTTINKYEDIMNIHTHTILRHSHNIKIWGHMSIKLSQRFRGKRSCEKTSILLR